MIELTQTERDALEKLIDDRNLSEVVHALACICAEKADHIRANYDDKQLARRWDRAASKLTTAAVTCADVTA